jgi:hypothetical protein
VAHGRKIIFSIENIIKRNFIFKFFFSDFGEVQLVQDDVAKFEKSFCPVGLH